MNLYWQGLCDLAKRYLGIFKEVWKVRKQLDTPIREADENAFRPAHLELIDTPVSALPKWIGRLIMLFLLLAILWAWLGKVDIVVVAQGEITPSGRSKIIQPIETAVVKKVYVRNGEEVKKDQLLMELVALGAEADYSKSEEALKAAKLSQLRQRALLYAMDTGNQPIMEEDEQSQLLFSSEDSLFKQEQLLAHSQYIAWKAQKQKLEASIEQRQAEIKTTEIEVAKLQEMQKYGKELRDGLKKLYKKGHSSKQEYYAQEYQFIELVNNLNAQRSRLNELTASLTQANEDYRYYIESFRRDVLEQLRMANDNVTQFAFEVAKAKERQQFTEIRSPVEGTIQQLQTYTLGGVVTTAQSLMVIVPKQDYLEVEAMIGNKDIGFVNMGQDVVIKIEAFPYTRYGYLTGKVKTISFDAIDHEQLGPVFATTILMDQSTLLIEGKMVELMAGMAVSAEIKTGKRSVLDYLFSPLKTTLDESLRER
ncbi:HlyD family type I secretion periplasmic adaptor subunit [Pasteurella multocida]|uniref:HlyD family type I secretion periplasmic adaptor subunit n=1 Tax=Pasteurella multocida TaxID=747 RepID=UPI00193BAC4F|nr:HlyD family type I secretion periplasmic adaptor subunit [Pasteurella multocida]MBM2607614.1 HlyD family type I secretion periplasmic adaptor subunit [Pasteurella multocida]